MINSEHKKNRNMHSPLFICGFPSGGTDLIKTVLNAHPDIYINGEMPFLQNLERFGYSATSKFRTTDELELLQRRLREIDYYHNVENISHNFSIDLAMEDSLFLGDTLYALFSARVREIWGNKTPQNTEHMDALIRLFPCVRFLIITRDVRDVCLSWHNKWGKDIKLCAAKWAQRMKQGWLATQQLDPTHYHFVKFEDILTNTETTLREICQFLAIPFSTRILEHQAYTTAPIDGKMNYGQAIKSDNKEKWRTELAKDTITRIEAIAFDTMTLLTYQPEFALEQKPLTLFEARLGKICDIWALVAIGNRARKKNDLKTRIKNIVFEFKKHLRR